MQYRLRLSIADLPFEILTDRRSTARFLETYFGAYRTDDAPGVSILVAGSKPFRGRTPSERVVPELEPDSPGVWRIFNNSSERITIGYIDERESWCSLDGCVRSNPYLLSSAIRLCMQFFLERHGGFFLHGACGTVRGKGVLFTGKSTAGKSTALYNLRPEAIIAEDAAALRITKGETMVYAVPFRGELPSHAVLTALCFPRKWTGTPKLLREGAAAVAAELAANALFCAPGSEALMSAVLGTIVDCSVSVSGYDCYFDKSTDLFTVFRDHGIFN
jgi:hypothetical protein